MANKARREMSITLAGKQFVLKPTFEAMCEFEDAANISAMAAMQETAKGRGVSLKVIAAAFWSGIRGATHNDRKHLCPSFGEIGGLVQDEGLANVMPYFVEYMVNGLSSGNDLVAKEESAVGKLRSGEATTP